MVTALDQWELDKRQRRRSSIIIHGVMESGSNDSAERRGDDGEIVTEMFGEMGCGVVKVDKIFRLGKRSTQSAGNTGERPLKLVLQSEEMKNSVLSKAKNLKDLKEGKWKRIFIHQDLTPQEREERRRTLMELKARQVSGEKNLMLFRGKIVVKNGGGGAREG